MQRRFLPTCTLLIALAACSGAAGQNAAQTETEPQNMSKITVEIWSDVMCPFCYIGKRQFEAALAAFPEREQVEVTWRSFQLNPSLQTDPSKSVLQSLADSKGWSLAQARQAMEQVSQMAAGVGLAYDFERAVVANSFDAHRFTHLAKKHGLQDEAEERLFAAYFCEGKNTADHATLTQLGLAIGLEQAELEQVLGSDAFAEEVRQDLYEAHQVGLTGVPFFLFQNKYTVSGARGSELFLQVLERVLKEAEE